MIHDILLSVLLVAAWELVLGHMCGCDANVLRTNPRSEGRGAVGLDRRANIAMVLHATAWLLMLDASKIL